MRRAFTLIELLIVIAIIGILAAMIIVSLNAARQKAKDGRIKTSLGETQVFAEKYYSKHQSYFCLDRDNADCSMSGSSGKYDPAQNLWLTTIKPDIERNGGTSIGLPTQGPSYVAHSILNDGTQWCVDSSGYEGLISGSYYYDGTSVVKCISP